MLYRITSPGLKDFFTHDDQIAYREAMRRYPDVDVYLGKAPLETAVDIEEVAKAVGRNSKKDRKMAPLLFSAFSMVAEIQVIEKAIRLELYREWFEHLEPGQRALIAMSLRAAREECWRRIGHLYSEQERDLSRHMHIKSILRKLARRLQKTCWEWLTAVVERDRELDCLLTRAIENPDLVPELASRVASAVSR